MTKDAWSPKSRCVELLSGRNSGVECQLPKLNVVGSNPIARSNLFGCKRIIVMLVVPEKWALPAFLFLRGTMVETDQTYREKIVGLIEPIVESEQMELVDVECLRGPSRWMVRIYIDKEGGVTLDDCAMISGETGDVLDIHETPPAPYDLEISSPGLDRPLAKDRDFVRYEGCQVRILVAEKIEGKKNFKGRLVKFLDNEGEKSLVIDVKGMLYTIPRSMVVKANLKYEI